jgi:Tfp pilus assembly protein PilO
MMPTGLLSQISLIILSVGVIFTYVTPTLDEIKKTQDTITVYETEKEKVSDVNLKLDQVASTLNSISTEDQRKLLAYMPDSVDTVSVPRDIKAIADNNGLILEQITYVGPEEPAVAATFVDPSLSMGILQSSGDPEAHTFSVEFESSYEQVKQFLSDLEKNAYPLEVHDLVIEQTEGGFLSVEMKLVTYDRITPPPPVDPSFVAPPTEVTS